MPPPTLMRHIAACNDATLPGERVPFRVDGVAVGWVRPGLDTDVDAADLPAHGRRLADRGLCRWRDEAFDVRAHPEGPVLATIDRGALPLLGIAAQGVHLNGLVAHPDGPRLWVARRAAGKALDPGKLDHLAAGGVPAGLTPREALVKEAEEEAGLDPAIVAAAIPVAVIDYAMDRTEGLRRDRLHCYDLWLPPDWVPEARDGEVAGFALWPMGDVLAAVRDTESFKFNVNLVLIDLLLRLGLVRSGTLRAALDQPSGGAALMGMSRCSTTASPPG